MLPDEDLSGAPAGEAATAPESLSVAAAASMLNQMEEEAAPPSSEPAVDQQPEAAQPEEPAAAAPEGEEPAEPVEGEPEETGEDTEPEEAPLDFESLHGNTKLRLRDGSEVTVGDLKKKWGQLQEVERHAQEFETQRSQFQQWAAQQAQHAQLFAQIGPKAIELLEANMPKVLPMPPAELLNENFLEYQRQMDAHNRSKADVETKQQELGQMRHAAALQQRQSEQERQEAHKAYVENEKQALLKKMPDLRDPAKAKQFAADYVETAKAYGFSEQEASGVADHRLFALVKDAMAYRKLKANPPKPAPKPAGQAQPPAAPGRRQSAPEVKAQAREDLMQRANKPGGLSVREAASLLSELGRN